MGNVFLQTCMAWSALDVFALASIAASLQLSRVSQWILNQNYAEICGPGGIIPNAMEKLIGKPTQCFGVDGYLVPGIALVCGVSISSWIICIYTIRQIAACKQQIKRQLLW